ncbi:hypothetical protein GOODEAATRI_032735, partial [Goodea atripinnis]
MHLLAAFGGAFEFGQLSLPHYDIISLYCCLPRMQPPNHKSIVKVSSLLPPKFHLIAYSTLVVLGNTLHSYSLIYMGVVICLGPPRPTLWSRVWVRHTCSTEEDVAIK